VANSAPAGYYFAAPAAILRASGVSAARLCLEPTPFADLPHLRRRDGAVTNEDFDPR
jgi:hypothetical protein